MQYHAIMLQADNHAPVAHYPRGAAIGFALAWSVFCALQLSIVVQEYLQAGGESAWDALLWGSTSLMVSSAVAVVYFRHIHRFDRLLSQPWRWFGLAMASVPVVSAAVAALVAVLRFAVFTALGRGGVQALSGAVFMNELLYCATFYMLFLAVLFGLRSFMAMSAARIAAARSDALAQHAQLLQLTQQLQPHFLFNALTTIAEAIRREPALAERLLLELSRLLRAATDLSVKPESRLDDEIRLLEAYALIMEQRFADRARVRFDVDPAVRSCVVPTMLLQPLLENAFRHGVERHTGPCSVVIAARQAGNRLELEVQDDVGTLAHTPAFGVGLSNLRQRLLARYGVQAVLSLEARAGQRGVIARIEMPCES